MLQNGSRYACAWLIACPCLLLACSPIPVDATSGGKSTSTVRADAGALLHGSDGGRDQAAGRDQAPGSLLTATDAATIEIGPASLSLDGRTCGVTTHEMQRIAPEILLVLDRSPSMVEQMATGPVCQTRTCGTRWDEVTAALQPALESTESGIDWGLKTFPDDAACLVKDGATVPVAPNNAATIIATYTGNPPITHQGYTPTREAVLKAGTYLRNLGTPNPKSIILATDGEPNCSQTGSDPGTGAPDEAIAAVASVAASGIPTYVVGVATDTTRTNQTLNEMAQEGGRPRNNSTTQYYLVDTAEDLVKAMDTIAVAAASCTFSLSSEPPVPDNVAVDVDGERVGRDPTHADGWDYGPDMKTIELQGELCDRVKNNQVDSLVILFGCPDQKLIL